MMTTTTREAEYVEVARLLADICDVWPAGPGENDELVAKTILEDDDGAGADELLAAVNAALAPAYAAGWTGDSVTYADGTTCSYVAIRRAEPEGTRPMTAHSEYGGLRAARRRSADPMTDRCWRG